MNFSVGNQSMNETSKLREKIESLPETTGIYLFKDTDGNTLYIGKAKSIKNRVKSHFSPAEGINTDVFITNNTAKIEFMLTDSEIEALLLEAELIKKYSPKYNIKLQDDKTYPYIIITEEDFPRVLIRRVRKKEELKKFRHYFGPFTDVGAIKRTLNFLFKLFPICSCYPQRKQRIRPCLKYQLKKCSAPCVEKITQEDYLKNILNIELFLEGKKKDLLEEFKQSMQQASDNLDFETAALLRDHIWALEKTIINQKVISAEPEESLGIVELKEILDLPNEPRRIEAFDISNLSGTDPTGSLVLFINGKPSKGGYRRYKVRITPEPNDIAMIEEVLERRFKRLIAAEDPIPDLVIIDGGKPQLNTAIEVLSKLNLTIPVIGLAKRFEHVFKPNRPNPIVISPDSPALFLLQRVRDEAHRFALKYHHILRRKHIG